MAYFSDNSTPTQVLILCPMLFWYKTGIHPVIYYERFRYILKMLFYFFSNRRKSTIKSHHYLAPIIPEELVYFFQLSFLHCQRFFYKNMFSRFQRFQHKEGMCIMRSGYENCIDVSIEK